MSQQDQEKIEVAERVYKALEDDGFYGPYVLGQELWDEFKRAFNIEGMK